VRDTRTLLQRIADAIEKIANDGVVSTPVRRLTPSERAALEAAHRAFISHRAEAEKECRAAYAKALTESENEELRELGAAMQHPELIAARAKLSSIDATQAIIIASRNWDTWLFEPEEKPPSEPENEP
jgi:hypothetical protein